VQAPRLLVVVGRDHAVLAEEREVRQHLTHTPASLASVHKVHTDRGGGPGEVGLAHEVVEDLGLEQPRGNIQQLGLAVHGQDDDPYLAGFGRGVAARAVGGIAGGVRELGSNVAKREVVSDYQVVVGAALMSPVILGGGLAVKLAASWW
jgi:hypothetical protein